MAAIFYDVDIDVAIKTRTTQVHVEQVHSYNQNTSQSKNAEKSTRIIYFDGNSHFKIGQKHYAVVTSSARTYGA